MVPGPHSVVRLEYDPNRSADLALLRNQSSNELSYIIRPSSVNPGDVLYSFRNGLTALEEQTIPKNVLLQPGNCLQLADIPVGSVVHSISLTPSGAAIMCRSAGTSAQILSKTESGFAQVKLSSSETRLIPLKACATMGVVGNEAHKLTNLGKAGAKRRKGIRPTVRGIAMNAHDHPHGGGSKSKGGKAPRSPWGWKTKGVKTVRRKKWFVVTPKWKAKKDSR
jgi:ribosomal protein L2